MTFLTILNFHIEIKKRQPGLLQNSTSLQQPQQSMMISILNWIYLVFSVNKSIIYLVKISFTVLEILNSYLVKQSI